jgi:hypothetical protein
MRREQSGDGGGAGFYDRTTAAFDVAEELVDFAQRLARERGHSPFEMPELMLLAALQMAARIDGTAEGTREWIQAIARRLSDDSVEAHRRDA